MAEQRRRGRRAAADDGAAAEPAAETTESKTTKGWFVICRVDEMGTLVDDAVQNGVRIGEKLTVIKVVQSDSSDKAAREHRRAMEAEWKDARAKGEHPDFPDGLPEQFPVHRYRAIGLGAFTPGHFAEEVRDTRAGTF